VIQLGNKKWKYREQYESCSMCDWWEKPEGWTPPPKKKPKPPPPISTIDHKLARPGDKYRRGGPILTREIRKPERTGKKRDAPLDRKAHRPLSSSGRIVINANKHGFGDACVTAWISEGSKGEEAHLVHFATGAKKEFLELLGQEVVSEMYGSRTTFSAYSHELRQKGDPPRVYQRGAYFGVTATPKRPPVLIRQEELDAADHCILLFPNTEYGSREWPPSYWLELARLLIEAGEPIRVMGGHRDNRYSHLPGLWGQKWERVAAWMAKSKCVVGNDSGPAHLAGTIDAPTIVLMGPSQPSMFIHAPSVKCLQVGRDVLDCSGCYFHAPFTRVCETGCLALAHLKPEVVFEAVMEHKR
jgi:hypothetical protein